MTMRDDPNTTAWNRPHLPRGGAEHRGHDHAGVALRQSAPRPYLLVRPHGEITIIEFLNAQLLYQDRDIEEIGASLLNLARDGHNRILLNLQGVEFASSALLGSVAWLHRKVVNAAGFLRLYGLEPVVREALRICRLDRTLEIYDDEAEALAGDRST
jgi:anti-anti-sigma factor